MKIFRSETNATPSSSPLSFVTHSLDLKNRLGFQSNSWIESSVVLEDEDDYLKIDGAESPNYIDSLGLRRHCEIVLQLIVEALPIAIAWILTKDHHNKMSPQITYLDQGTIPQKRCDVIDGLLGPELMSMIETPRLEGWKHPNLDSYLYGIPLILDSIDPQYLLVLAEQELSIDQIQWLDCQILILRDYFSLDWTLRQQQQKLLALQQTIRRTSHQIGTPLSLIQLYSSLLSQASTDTVVRDLTLPLQQAAEHLQCHIDDLGGHPKDKTSFEYCDLKALIDEVTQSFNPRLEARGSGVEIPLNSIWIWMNRWDMYQVFDNLIGNAISFSPQNGRIMVSWEQYKSEVLIEVCDEGSGLSEEDLRCAFSPHYSRRAGGKGLGLAIAQQIICDHQGRLWVSNRPEGGAKFSICLPSHDEP